MASIEKTVFISYRRDDIYEALAVYQYLNSQQYDVFLDYQNIPSGDFEQIIVSNIKARAHFIIILTPTALDRCSKPGDWLRREIETAIDEKRNVIPLFFNNFSFSSPGVDKKLTGKLVAIKRYNGLNIPTGYFIEAMERLCEKYLNVKLDAVIHPVSNEVQKAVEEAQLATNQALEEKKESIDVLVKPVEDKQVSTEEGPEQQTSASTSTGDSGKAGGKKLDTRLYGIGAGILLLILLGVAGLLSKIPDNTPVESPTPTATMRLTQTPEPTKKIPDAPVETIISTTPSPIGTPTTTPTSTITPTPTFGIMSTMTSDVDGMTLLYVPAGEFIRGNDNSRENDEKPALPIYLDAFWIDKTEITNAMYRRCVEAGQCKTPVPRSSETRNSYYANRQFNNFPVINVSWDDAYAYCAWAGRRLPTEAEWEKAASWDEMNQQKLTYPWGGDNSISCSLANYNGHTAGCENDTTQVGSYESGASPYGVLDMAGNVWEWVYDNYDPGFYDDPGTDLNPQRTIANSDYRVVRGGSWSDSADILHAANRFRVDENTQQNNLGFRCVLPVSTPLP